MSDGRTSTGITGTWDLKLKTPIGTLDAVYRFTDTADGTITATATGRDETVPLADITCDQTADGQLVRWRQSVTKPIRLNLHFEVLVNGDMLTGHSRAGRLPRTKVIGTRRGGPGN